MNKENAKDYLPFVQALAEGKTIQCLVSDGTWEDRKDLAFDSNPSIYRIKPEPLTMEVWMSENGRVTEVDMSAYAYYWRKGTATITFE